MVHERILIILAMLLCVAPLAGCPKKPEAPPTPSTAKSDPKDPDPHWVIQQKPPAKVALVFVHGVTGDMIETWTAGNGKTFWGLVDENDELKGKTDAFVFGFPSYVFKPGSFDIQEAANRLHERIKYGKVLDYPAVVFVAHSMGGLVVLRELLTHPEIREKVPVVMFYATPMEGALIAAVGKEFSPNSALSQMTPADGNALLQLIDSEWKQIPDDKRPKVSCAYEKEPLGLTKIVPWSSATRFCTGPTPPIEANHSSIVKPDRPTADAIIYLANALNSYVLGRDLDAKLETPDFSPEGVNSIFLLTNVYGKQSARLVNVGGGTLKFTLAEIDPALLLWPDDTPRPIGKQSTVNISVALSRAASKKEYPFILRTDIDPDRHVIVRVTDPAALNAQQSDTAAKVAQRIKDTLSDPVQLISFRHAPTDDKAVPSAIVEIARAEIAKQNPALPVSAQWVLSADLLNSFNWPSLAAEALRNAEKASPTVTKMPGVQYLAALVSAQSGDNAIFASGTPIIDKIEFSSLRVKQPLATAEYFNLGTDVAKRMQDVPALRVYGWSLQGDVENAQGNAQAARESFKAAAAIRPSPSVTTRLQALDFTGNATIPTNETSFFGKGQLPTTERRVDAAKSTYVRSEMLAPSDFKVGLNTVGVSEDRWMSLEERLSQIGYQLDKYSYAYSTRASWMAQKPAVLYYSDSARPAANRLAAQMKQMTGESFMVQRGAGLGVEPGEEAMTLFVHIPK
jgi:pimeloyl-ACP methyl ester carboxylesterase